MLASAMDFLVLSLCCLALFDRSSSKLYSSSVVGGNTPSTSIPCIDKNNEMISN